MSSLRKLAPPGTGGTIESEQGNMLVAFSGPIRIGDSSRAESISIREELKNILNSFSGPWVEKAN